MPANNIKIVHCADFHLDSPLALSGKAPIANQDLRATFERVCQFCDESNADICLISGDLFDNECSTPMTRDFILHTLSRHKNTRFFMCTGNHDYYHEKSIYAVIDFPSNVYIFTSAVPDYIDLPELNTRIYGIGCDKPYNDCRLLDGFKVHNNVLINIMLFHGNIVSKGSVSDYFPVSADEIEKTGLDYLALGHIHSFSGIKKVGSAAFAYPGIPQGRGFDETGDKGIITGTVSKLGVNLDFKKIADKIFIVSDIDISSSSNIYELRDIIQNSAVSNSFTRINLTGVQKFPLNIKELENSLDNFLYLEITDSTSFPEDFDQLASERTLKGFFVSDILERKQQNKDIFTDALKYGLLALEGEDIL